MNSTGEGQWRLGLLHLNLFSVLVFEVLYKAFGTYCFFPFLIFLIRRFITGVGEDLITTENLKLFFSTPYNILVLLVCILIVAYYFLLEISVLTQAFHSSVDNKSCHFLTLFYRGFKTSLRYFHPFNWLAFILIFAFLPFLHFGLTSGIAEILYAQTMIKLHTGLILSRAVVIGTLSGMLVLSIFFCFAFVFFVQNDVNFLTSCVLSLMVYKERFFYTLWSVIQLMLFIFLAAVAGMFLLALSVFLTYEILIMGTDQTAATVSTQLLRQLTEIASPCVALYFLLYSVLGTTCFFSGVYGYLYYKEKDKKTVKKPKRYFTAIILSILIIGYSLFQGAAMADSISNDSLLAAQTGGILTGHRGNMKEEVENTQASFDNAIMHGAEYIELDVRRTSDNVLVLCHDNSLSYLTGEYVKIDENPYDKLKNLIIRYKDVPNTTPNQHLLTLDEAIENTKGKAKLNIELKTVTNEDGFVQQVIDTVKKHGIQDSCYLASGNYEYVKEIEATDPSLKTLFLTESNYGDIENLVADGLSLQFNAIDADIVKRVHLKGKMIHAWILVEDSDIERMIDLGVDYLITNDVRMGQIALAKHRPGHIHQLITVLKNVLIQS